MVLITKPGGPKDETKDINRIRVLFYVVEDIPTLAINIPLKLTQRKFGKSHAVIHQGLSNPERRAYLRSIY